MVVTCYCDVKGTTLGLVCVQYLRFIYIINEQELIDKTLFSRYLFGHDLKLLIDSKSEVYKLIITKKFELRIFGVD